ncbi:hypothetical protein [Morganella morganii]|uniref:hypothetical protein n=1 Tax=Morganella morganii TaxID=582 RepID=UPI0023689C02|nr:hypothetical protein [Morganella morganii]
MDNTDDKKFIVFGTEMSRDAIEVIITAVTPSVQRVAEYGAINGWNEDEIAAATSAAARGIGKGIRAIVDSHNIKRGS